MKHCIVNFPEEHGLTFGLLENIHWIFLHWLAFVSNLGLLSPDLRAVGMLTFNVRLLRRS